jgi:hypothetical protein
MPYNVHPKSGSGLYPPIVAALAAGIIARMGKLAFFIAFGVMNVDAVSTSTGFLSATFTHNKF